MTPRSALAATLRTRIAALVALASSPVAAAGEPTAVTVHAEPGGVARVTASIDIAAPPAVIWAIMLDCAAAPAFVPGLDTCRVVETGPNGAWDVREHVVSWARLLPPSRNVFRSDYAPQRSIRFERVEGPFNVMEGEWTLEAIEDGQATRVGYRSRVGVPWPGSGPLVRRAARRNTPEILAALCAYATDAAATP